MVEDYLKKNVLIFDPEVLKELFKEADYKDEGSLDVRSLSAAISGELQLTPCWECWPCMRLGRYNCIIGTQVFENVKGQNEPSPYMPHVGRYPKRKLTKEWRQLVALLLRIPELVLTEDFVNQKVAVNVRG